MRADMAIHNERSAPGARPTVGLSAPAQHLRPLARFLPVQATMTPPDIHATEDHLRFLADWYAWQKTVDPTFSYRRFAVAAGQASGTILEAVISGRRMLTVARATAFARAMELDPEATQRFLLLVRLHRARSRMEREQDELQEETGERVHQAAERRLHTTQEEVELHTRELAGLAAWRSYRRQRLRPPETLAAAVADLARPQVPFHAVLSTQGEPPSAPAGRLLDEVERTALALLDRREQNPPPPNGNLSRFLGLTQAYPASRLDRVNEETTTVLRRILARCGERQDGTAVAIYIDVFALSQRLEPEAAPAPVEPDPIDPADLPNIYDFVAYRPFVERWFEYRRAEATADGERFSLGRFANAAGLVDRTLPQKIITGRQRLTTTTARDFARGMGLDADEEQYLALLVQHEQESEEERPAIEERMQMIRVLASSRRLQSRVLKALAEWQHFAIYEMASCSGMPNTAAGIAAAMLPPIAEADVAAALATLQGLGMLHRGPDGRLVARDTALIALTDASGADVNAARRRYHRQMHVLGTQAHEPTRIRHTLVLRLDEAGQREVQHELSELARRLLGLGGTWLAEADAVFQTNLSVFPIPE